MKFKSGFEAVGIMQLLSCFSIITAASLRLDSNLDGSSNSAAPLHSTGMPLNNSRHSQENSGFKTLHRNLTFLLDRKEFCQKDIFAVIMVCSSAENFVQRTAIRETWGIVGRQSEKRTKVLFLLGLPDHGRVGMSNKNIQKEIEKEYYRYGDIIEVNFQDSYRNLSLKSVAMLKWMDTYCKIAKFLLKTDDDVFINTNALLNDLHNSVHSRFTMGNIIAAAQPIRDRTSKWYTPSPIYSEQMYPKYISGTAYIISGDLLPDLFKVALQSDLFLWEDIFITGICAKKLDAKHIFNAKFGFKKRISDPCLFRMLITGHRMTPEEQRNLWNMMNDASLVCPYPVKKQTA